MTEHFQKSVVLITSRDSNITAFGTGFVIHQEGGAVYIVTCAHVVRDVGGNERVQVEGYPAIVLASGEEKEEKVDLAVLKVDRLWDIQPLSLKKDDDSSHSFVTAGFYEFGNHHQLKPLKGHLGEAIELVPSGQFTRIRSWELKLAENYYLKRGYSGSPVLDPETQQVFGVVSLKQGDGKMGVAISIEELNKIWQLVDRDRLYKNLLKLGYRHQVRLFRKLIATHSVAGFLIHGSPEYGQRWLLNRLVSQYVPRYLTGKIIKVNLSRRVRRNDLSALWREVGGRVGLRGVSSSPLEIADRIYRWWQTQNVLLVFHDVHSMPETGVCDLLEQFWLPLAKKTRIASGSSKLLMFLLDYQGCVGGWSAPFAERLDEAWEPQQPLRSPQIAEFSDDDLTRWLEDEYDELPGKLTTDLDRTVRDILENSSGGVPEYAFVDICDRCGCDWYEESERWLKL